MNSDIDFAKQIYRMDSVYQKSARVIFQKGLTFSRGLLLNELLNTFVLTLKFHVHSKKQSWIVWIIRLFYVILQLGVTKVRALCSETFQKR
jgi:hypothetical protein